MTLPYFLTRNTWVRSARRDIASICISLCSSTMKGYTSEMLHNEYPTLSLDLIHKVLALYFENKAEVDAYVAEAESTIEQDLHRLST